MSQPENEQPSLSEIIEACKDGRKPDYDDLRLAVCVLESLSIFDHMDMRRAINRPNFYTPTRIHDEMFRRWKRATERPPVEWLGWQNHPDNPEHQQAVARSRRIIDSLAPKTED